MSPEADQEQGYVEDKDTGKNLLIIIKEGETAD